MENMINEKSIGPTQLSIDITNRCNLRCLHCFNNSGCNQILNDELSDEEVLTFIDSLEKLKLYNFCFCGGEPLIRKNLLIEAAKHLKRMGVDNISMVTNGLLLSEDVFLDLTLAGINRIQISIDGGSPQSHDYLRGCEGAFEKSMNAVKMMLSHGFEPEISYCPTKMNLDEIDKLQAILRDAGMKKKNIRTQPLMLLGRAQDNLAKIAPSQSDYRLYVQKIDQLNREHKIPLIEWGDPVDHILKYLYLGLPITTCIIRSNGDLAPDPYLPVVVGNIKRHSFYEYWEAGFRDIWKNKLLRAVASNIKSIGDMGIKYENIPVVWKDSDIVIDLIDD